MYLVWSEWLLLVAESAREGDRIALPCCNATNMHLNRNR